MLQELLKSENFVIGNVFLNMSMLGGSVALILWRMKNVEKKVGQYCTENREDHKELYESLSEHAQRITVVETVVNMRKVER